MKKKYKYAIFGAILGVPLSYFFQPKLVRQFLGFFDYINNFGDLDRISRSFGSNTIRNNIILSVLVFAAIGFALGYFKDKSAKSND
ncbi:MAG: hypothetical protein AAF617_12615 [Bacteroidota bacterium]